MGAALENIRMTIILGLADKRDWEATFTSWARPPGKTEEEKCERAITAINNAVLKSTALTSRSVTVFAQGSYRNRTNVRQDSDVDVCVLSTATFYHDTPDAAATAQLRSWPPAEYGYDQYKDDVEAALVAQFGRQFVKRGNKAFNIRENSYRIDADAVACFQYRHYYRNWTDGLGYHAGTMLITDKERIRISNFPAQQFESGQQKNFATARRFRQLVRIVKCLRNEMDEHGVSVAKPIPSYLIESLVWNWSDKEFMQVGTFERMVRNFLAWIGINTQTNATCGAWREANNIKRLFGQHSVWTREQVNAFAIRAHNYVIGV